MNQPLVYIYPLPLEPSPPPPSHPSRLSQAPDLNSLCHLRRVGSVSLLFHIIQYSVSQHFGPKNLYFLIKHQFIYSHPYLIALLSKNISKLGLPLDTSEAQGILH